ncbi:hypothetical protein BDR07DRAFT_196837 [Suillus spraguei]|nr:hypothetical protein BDR07DRAFT_196837 [Suillus spraguei]
MFCIRLPDQVGRFMIIPSLFYSLTWGKMLAMSGFPPFFWTFCEAMLTFNRHTFFSRQRRSYNLSEDELPPACDLDQHPNPTVGYLRVLLLLNNRTSLFPVWSDNRGLRQSGTC